MTEQTEALPDNIKRGIQLLDERAPGWEARVDLHTLNMEWHGLCLLSQLFGSYEEGIRQLDAGPLLIETDFAGSTNWDNYGSEYGFTISPLTKDEESSAAFAQLTSDWKRVIAQKCGAL